jgi:hypothetical protein
LLNLTILEFASVTDFEVMLMLLVKGPYFETPEIQIMMSSSRKSLGEWKVSKSDKGS